MIQNLINVVSNHYNYYMKFFDQEWCHMSPYKYGTLLISIGVFGWLLMKSGNKRS